MLKTLWGLMILIIFLISIVTLFLFSNRITESKKVNKWCNQATQKVRVHSMESPAMSVIVISLISVKAL